MKKKKPINTRLHGLIDYTFGLTLLLPWIVDYHQASAGTLLLGGVGMLVMLMSLLTNYELGLIRLLPMKLHLILDVIISIFLMMTPWLFTLYDYQLYWPMLLGTLGLLIALLSSPEPFRLRPKETDISRP